MTSRMKPLFTTAEAAAKLFGVDMRHMVAVTAGLQPCGSLVKGDPGSVLFLTADIENSLKLKGIIE